MDVEENIEMMNIEENEIEAVLSDVENEIDDALVERLIFMLNNDYDKLKIKYNVSFKTYHNLINQNIRKLLSGDLEYNDIKNNIFIPILEEWYSNILYKRKNSKDIITNYFEKRITEMSKNMLSFLENGDSTFLKNKDTLDDFCLEQIGKGAYGVVYNSIADNCIIKILHCPRDPKTLMCYNAVNGIIYKTTYSDKNIMYIPNNICENIIGFILNQLCVYVPYFPSNFGMVWEDYKISTVYEKLQTNLFTIEKMKNGENLLLTIIQFLGAICIAQQTLEFTHYDTHLENILYNNTEPNTWNRIFYKDCEEKEDYVIEVRNPGWNIKLGDFSLSRLQYNNTIYCGIDKINQGKFSHSIDYLTFFGCLFYENFDVSKHNYSSNFKKIITEMRDLIKNDPFLTELAQKTGFRKNNHIFYAIACPSVIEKGIELIDDKIAKIYDEQNNYRPNCNYVFTKQNKFKTPDQMLQKIIDILGKYYPDMFVKNVDNVSANCYGLNKYLFIPMHNIKNQPRQYKSTFCNIPHNIEYIKEFDSSFMSYRKFLFKNVLKERSSLDANTHISNIIMHVCKIKFDKEKMNLISDCCGMDVIEYMQNVNHYGIAINGVFFDLLGNKFPIGYYKDKRNNRQEKEIPKLYKKYYHQIGIKNNELVIGDNLDDYFAMSGPLLIDKKNNFVFTEDLLETKVNDIDIFKCIHTIHNSKLSGLGHLYIDTKGERRYTDREYYNCKAISPGELSHAGNRNPRSALAYNKSKNFIYFIVFQGRTKKALGVSVATMAEYIYKMDNNIDFAINLDGGCSSNIAVKTDSKTIYTLPTEICARPYVSGNLFSILLKN